MISNDYQNAILRTAAGNGLSTRDALVNAGLGLSGETGEYVDLLKKHFFHKHELDLVKCKAELGDILFYIAWAAHSHGFTLGDVMQANIDKLIKRYPNGFNPFDSIARKDVNEEENELDER